MAWQRRIVRLVRCTARWVAWRRLAAEWRALGWWCTARWWLALAR